MVALPADGTNPCMALQPYTSTSTVGGVTLTTLDLYPATGGSWPAIAKNGVLIEFSSAITALNTAGFLTSSILQTTSLTSTSHLIQFLSRGGPAAADTVRNYSTFKDTLLYTGNYIYAGNTIVERIASALGKTPATYTYPKTGALLLQDPAAASLIWNAGDDTAAVPTSILGKLMKDGLLLTQNNIYTAQTGSSSNSLFYFYSTEEKTPLTPSQTAAKIKLEATNLRFYGAFFIEYCYYKSRYELLLSEYFKVYQQTSTGTNLYQPITTSSPQYVLYGSAPETTYANGSQSEYLGVLAYHLACLNTRLTDMRKILDMINTYYSGVFANLQSAVNADASVPASTASLKASVLALQNTSAQANEYLKDEDFRKGVMDYTSEKNRYANILLGFYAFLNLSALAVIVYSM
jgi:hypothetical protein